MRDTRTTITTEQAPAAVGPYAQAIVWGRLVFTAGQIPLDPATGGLVEGPIDVQARRVLDNLRAVLEAADSSLDRVVKATVFMTDLGQFAAMNAVYAEYFPADPPARSAVQVAALPRGASIEIECVAVTRDR